MSQPTWYLENVKRKENRDWSDSDKLMIYNMRMRHKPVAFIADKFKATANQIHNITRLTKKGLKQQCYHCSSLLTDEEAMTPKSGLIKACNKCRTNFLKYKKDRRKEALKRHLCGICGTQPILKGHTSCKECISSTYRRRKKEGLCGRCGERPIKNVNGGLCAQCIIAMNTKLN